MSAATVKPADMGSDGAKCVDIFSTVHLSLKKMHLICEVL